MIWSDVLFNSDACELCSSFFSFIPVLDISLLHGGRRCESVPYPRRLQARQHDISPHGASSHRFAGSTHTILILQKLCGCCLMLNNNFKLKKLLFIFLRTTPYYDALYHFVFIAAVLRPLYHTIMSFQHCCADFVIPTISFPRCGHHFVTLLLL